MDNTNPASNIQPDRIKFDFLDAKKMHLFRGPYGAVRMTIDGHDRSYLKVTIATAFPLSEPNHYIGFLDGTGNDIGTIREISELPADAQQIVCQELDRRYFLPKIKKISVAAGTPHHVDLPMNCDINPAGTYPCIPAPTAMPITTYSQTLDIISFSAFMP